jgi:5-formyltetrahydrofolate cyclo-ligase
MGDRRELSEAQQDAASQMVAGRVTELLGAATSGTVAGYVAHGGELDPLPALMMLHSQGWSIVLPVCGADAQMDFCPWSPGDQLAPNRYGIGEPTTAPVPVSDITVVLVPGVGFDARGARIGHGVGYYDRFFAKAADLGATPQRVALAHDLQLVELPEPEEWDVPMQLILTPSRVISVDSPPTEHR